MKTNLLVAFALAALLLYPLAFGQAQQGTCTIDSAAPASGTGPFQSVIYATVNIPSYLGCNGASNCQLTFVASNGPSNAAAGGVLQGQVGVAIDLPGVLTRTTYPISGHIEKYSNGVVTVLAQCTSSVSVVDNPPAPCTDSDGGVNYNVKGTASYGASSATDQCSSPFNLIGYYCNPSAPSGSSQVASQIYTCPGGCENGACIASTQPACSLNGGLQSITGPATATFTGTVKNMPSGAFIKVTCSGGAPDVRAVVSRGTFSAACSYPATQSQYTSSLAANMYGSTSAFITTCSGSASIRNNPPGSTTTTAGGSTTTTVTMPSTTTTTLQQSSSGCVAVRDSSVYRNDGCLYGSGGSLVQDPSCPAGGVCAQFSGTNAYVEVPHSTSLGAGSAMTVLLCAKPKPIAAGVNSPVVLVGKEGSGGVDYGVLLSSASNQGYGALGYYGSSEKLTGRTSLFDNKWHHLAGVYANGQLTLYIDGVPESSSSSPILSASQLPLYLASLSSKGPFFNGVMDEVKVYKRVLSASEIHADAQKCLPLPQITCPTSDPCLAMKNTKAVTTGPVQCDPQTGCCYAPTECIPCSPGDSCYAPTCTADSDCLAGYRCVISPGDAGGTCIPSTTHTVCISQQCVPVSGFGNSVCSLSSDDCKGNHMECSGTSCGLAGGIADDSCQSDDQCTTSTTLRTCPASDCPCQDATQCVAVNLNGCQSYSCNAPQCGAPPSCPAGSQLQVAGKNGQCDVYKCVSSCADECQVGSTRCLAGSGGPASGGRDVLERCDRNGPCAFYTAVGYCTAATTTTAGCPWWNPFCTTTSTTASSTTSTTTGGPTGCSSDSQCIQGYYCDLASAGDVGAKSS